jgi:hypothetical protein
MRRRRVPAVAAVTIPADRLIWGILCYAGSQDDPCYFDGWYADRAVAEDVCNYWRRKFQGWHVALIRQEDITWATS